MIELVCDAKIGVQLRNSHLQSHRGCPKQAKSRGGVALVVIIHKEDSTTPPIPYTMSATLPLRSYGPRLFEPRACLACSRSLSQIPRSCIATAAPRRWLSSAKSTRDGTVPRMDQMHARYKEKNRTVM